MQPELAYNRPPDYEVYDYSQEWIGKKLNDLAEKAIVRSLIEPATSCLELGGGFGRITSILEDYFAIVVSLDFSSKNIRLARRRLSDSNTSLLRADFRELPCKGNFFECIIMVRIAHHLADPHSLLDEVCRVARNRASIIISLPNPLLSPALKRHGGERHLVGTGKFGHRIYSTPFKAYSHKALILKERRGTGIFDNALADRFQSLPQLHLMDTVTSSLWPLKRTVFLKFQIRKES